MEHYDQKIELYFELKDTPLSSRESYWRRMQAFLSYMHKLGKPIERINEEDIQRYIIYLRKDKNLSPGTINNYISAIKFFYTFVLEKEWNPIKVPRMRRIKQLPVIPPREDILSMIEETSNLKHKEALDILRTYFKSYFSNTSYTPNDWLFPGQNNQDHINVKTIKNTLIKVRNKLELDPSISAHTLRHCFSTHAWIISIQLKIASNHNETQRLYSLLQSIICRAI
ncbi:phage integrase N-terminal SAM-like domain-containing protein [Robertmurraya massiliosenegalensis]|uniref:tyrosine-type recombinase/integrase n=1 Tax=Robertmurraya TaxID=2837507 RepID=UPI0039A4234E